MNDLRALLEQMRDFFQKDSDLYYRGDLDMVLREGREFKSVPWVTWRGTGWRRGQERNCFQNAFRLSQRHELTYVEGFASTFGLPVHHAWCVTSDGRVVDPTWRERAGVPVEEWQYIGIPFSGEFVDKTIFRKKTYGVLDDYDLYRKPLPAGAVVEVR